MTVDEQRKSISLWLRRFKPAVVLLTLANGERRELPRPLAQRGAWKAMEDAIHALKPVYMEALDDARKTLAARSMEHEEDAPEDTTPDVMPSTIDSEVWKRMKNGAKWQAIMAAIKDIMCTQAQLNVDAADRAVERVERAYSKAFEEQLKLVQISFARLEGLERAWHEMLMARAQEKADAGGDPGDALVERVIGAAMGGDAKPAKPNGAT